MNQTENFTLRPMKADEVNKLALIDRSERVETHYLLQDGQLVTEDVDWKVPPFYMDGESDHSLSHQISFCQSHLNAGGQMLGMFDGDVLAGIAVWTPNVRPALAQLAYLHVSRAYRRMGIARRLLATVEQAACDAGAQALYVSATPSGSAIGFYRSQGFAPAEPLPELFEMEPEDIHMVKPLQAV
jgi:ribosomal protein S18 acetylase RimI-like enzyme